MSFNHIYDYDISSDDAVSLNFLLFDYLEAPRRNNFICRDFKDFVFYLLSNGFKENEVLNLIIEAIYYVPRREILYECTINCDDYKDFEFGKFINARRVLMFKLYNEFSEKEFQGSLRKLVITNSTIGDERDEGDLFVNMEFLIDKWKNADEMKKAFDCLTKFNAKSDIPEIIRRFNAYDKSKNIELIVQSPTECSNLFVTLVKGDESSKPKFLVNTNDGPKQCEYNDDRSYPYPEQNTYKSVCLIFNIQNYANRMRRGSEIDVELIRKTFSDLYFTVQVYTDSTKNEMFEVVNLYSQVDVENAGSMFICFVLAHGEKDYIFDINEQLVSFRDLSMKFSAKCCEAYRGKPKIFFIQACQGDRYQEGFPPPKPIESEYTVPQIEQDGVKQNRVKEYKKTDAVPEEADFLMGMSTVPNHVSFRGVKYGSWYITELCKQIGLNASKCQLTDILTTVNYEVSKKQYGKNYCQLPTFCSTHMKRCFLMEPK